MDVAAVVATGGLGAPCLVTAARIKDAIELGFKRSAPPLSGVLASHARRLAVAASTIFLLCWDTASAVIAGTSRGGGSADPRG